MSKIEVNEIDKTSGSTLTLGGSGTAVTLACGATQTGFGRTGTVDWQTGSIKTATFTAANGEGYFADTSSGAFTSVRKLFIAMNRQAFHVQSLEMYF